MPAKQAIEASRKSAFMVDPSDVKIIGLDTEDGPEHPLYDERAFGKIPDVTIKNIMAEGVKQSITVCKEGDDILCVDGRRRLLAARKANEKLRQLGEEEIRVPAFVERGDERKMMGLSVALNEHRQEDDPITRAEKAQRFLDRGLTTAETAIHFASTPTAVAQWVRVLDCISGVKNAVKRGLISMSAAYELVNLSKEDQKKALEEMLATGKTTVADARDKRTQSRGGTPTKRGPGKRLIRKVIESEDAEDRLGARFIQGVQWAIGEVEADAVAGLEDIIEAVR